MFGPDVGRGGVCGVDNFYANGFKEDKRFQLAETLITTQDENGNQEIFSLCDAVKKAPRSADGKKAFLITDYNQTLLSVFVNDGRQFVKNIYKKGAEMQGLRIMLVKSELPMSI